MAVQNKVEIEQKSNRQIKLGAVMSYVTILVNVITGLVYTPWMVDKIGDSQYGIYSLVVALIGFFTMDFGMGNAVAKFLAKFNADGDVQKEKDFIGITIKIYAVLDVIIFCVLFIVFCLSGYIYQGLTPLELEQFRVVYLIMMMYSVLSFPFLPLNGILISHEQFAFYRFLELLNRVATVTTMIVVLYLGGRLYSLVIVNAVVGIFVIGLKLAYIWKKKLVGINLKAKDHRMMKSIVNFSIWSTTLIVAERFIFNIEPTLIGALSDSLQIAIFSAASTIEGYTSTLSSALGGLFLPKITRIVEGNKSEQKQQLQGLMERVGRIQLLVVGLLLTGLVMMGKEFMILWMGPEYEQSYYVMVLIISVYLITVTESIADTTLMVADCIHWQAICEVVTALTNVIISLILVPRFGAIGAGIGICVGSILGKLILKNIIYVKKLGINLWHFVCECYGKLIVAFLITGGVMWIAQKYCPVSSMFLFLIKVAVVCVFYVVIVWLRFLNESEKELVRSVVGAVKGKVIRK